MHEAIYLGAGVVLGAVGAFLLLKKQNQDGQQSFDQMLTVAKERLSGDKEEIKTDLNHKKELIHQMVEEIRRELTKTDERLRRSEEERVSSFASLKKQLEDHHQLTAELRGSTEELKRVLSNNQLRGQFGEQVAENLLKMAGFVIGQDYTANQAQEIGATSRPDFCVMLPDGTKINIDVKFPYQALQRMTATDNADEKRQFSAQFARDVKEKVKQVSTRDYINPEDGTVDFVILFIPNEMIFSFVYEHLHPVWQEAMEKKVILAGPFSFTAVLRMIKQAHSNFAFQKNIHGIINLIQKFRQEYGKFSQELDILGNRLESAAKQFQILSTTRDRQLTRVIDQIDGVQTIDQPTPPDQLEN